MAERSIRKRLSESRHLSDKKDPRNKKREKLLGAKRVAQQNRAASLAPTDLAATKATISRVGEYSRAAKKKSQPQFASRGKTKQHKF
jgi:hypothetical protein